MLNACPFRPPPSPQVAMKVNAALVLGLLFLSATIVRADTSDLGYEADFDVFDEGANAAMAVMGVGGLSQ